VSLTVALCAMVGWSVWRFSIHATSLLFSVAGTVGLPMSIMIRQRSGWFKLKVHYYSRETLTRKRGGLFLTPGFCVFFLGLFLPPLLEAGPIPNIRGYPGVASKMSKQSQGGVLVSITVDYF